MDKAHKEFIRKKYIILGDAIAPQVLEVVESLFVRGTISRYMKNDIIESNLPNYRKARKLLDLIPTRGGTAFEELYNAVKEQELYDAADILKPENAPHCSHSSPVTSTKDEYESPDESLPDNWPSDATFDMTVRMIGEQDTKMKAIFNKFSTPKGQELTYLMSAKIRGRVLVINNEEFDHLNKRDGTLEDRKALEKVFRDLLFDVEVEKNKTKEKLWELLEKESNNEYHSRANCFVLFILSHGHNGVVFGTDGKLDHNKKPINCIEIKDIVDLFCKSKNLQGKPKLIFIQACQGDEKNYGEPVGQADSSDVVPSDKFNAFKVDGAEEKADDLHNQTYVKTPVPKAQSDNDDINIILKKILPETESDAGGDKRPSASDVFLAMATLPGHLSWRNTVKGTWFVQAIAYIFAKFAYKHDLSQLMTRVTNLVGKAESEDRLKQQGENVTRLRKDLYFFPGLYEDK